MYVCRTECNPSTLRSPTARPNSAWHKNLSWHSATVNTWSCNDFNHTADKWTKMTTYTFLRPAPRCTTHDWVQNAYQSEAHNTWLGRHRSWTRTSLNFKVRHSTQAVNAQAHAVTSTFTSPCSPTVIKQSCRIQRVANSTAQMTLGSYDMALDTGESSWILTYFLMV